MCSNRDHIYVDHKCPVFIDFWDIMQEDKPYSKNVKNMENESLQLAYIHFRELHAARIARGSLGTCF
jgi:hypothetical protein